MRLRGVSWNGGGRVLPPGPCEMTPLTLVRNLRVWRSRSDTTTVKNLRISINQVDGGQLPLELETGKQLIERLFGDDFGAPPAVLLFEAEAADGTRVVIRVP